MTELHPEQQKYPLRELAKRVNGEVFGDPETEIVGISGVKEAQPGEITFIANPKYTPLLKGTSASAAIVQKAIDGLSLSQLIAKNPYYAFSQLVRLFHEKPHVPTGVSPQASIGKGVLLGSDVSIYPFVTVDESAIIGERVTLYSGVFVGAGASIGNDSVIHANASIREAVVLGERVIIHSGTVIGSDGFGFATHEGRHHKILQVGTVVVEDDVEIGSNCTVDRAAMGQTVIGRGTKIDNLVQVAHNVKIGEDCILVAQVGISGSTELGNFVTLAGQVGVVGHIKIGDHAMVGAKSGVSKDIKPNEAMSGIPAIPHRKWLAAQANLIHLPEFRKRLKA